MKKILPLLILLIAIACQDDPTYCFTCTTSEDGQSAEFTRCDITKTEAARIERNGTVIDNSVRHPYVVRYSKQTTCVKQ